MHDEGRIKNAHKDNTLTPKQAKEMQKCALDVEYFIRTYVMVQHPTYGAVLFKPYPYQEKIIDELDEYAKTIILQPRQSGKSTTLVAYLLHQTIFIPDFIVGVAAHIGDGAKEILERFRYAYENLPYWMKPGVVSYNVFDIKFDNGSKIMSATTTKNTFRGKSLSFLYLDEFAFVEPGIAQEFWKSIKPTLSAPGTRCVITSTPNTSEGKFAELWFKAEQGLNDYNSIRVYNEEVPYGDGHRDDAFKQEMLMDMTELEYAQEFECAFVSNKGTLINSAILEAIRPREAIREHQGLNLYKEITNKRLGVTVDVGTGTGQDFSVIQVFDLDNFEQLGEFRDNQMNITEFTKHFVKTLVYLFSEGAQEVYYTVEANSIGAGVIELIRNSTHPILDRAEMISSGKQYGILTTAKSKMKGCTKFKDLVESKRMTIYSKHLISELKFFVKSGASFAAERGKNDDLVMGCVLFSLMIEELATYDAGVYEAVNRVDSELGDVMIDEEGDDPLPFVI